MPRYPLFMLLLLMLTSNMARAAAPLQHIGESLWQLLAVLLFLIAVLLVISFGLKHRHAKQLNTLVESKTAEL